MHRIRAGNRTGNSAFVANITLYKFNFSGPVIGIDNVEDAY
jgi:hypothetical protein